MSTETLVLVCVLSLDAVLLGIGWFVDAAFATKALWVSALIYAIGTIIQLNRTLASMRLVRKLLKGSGEG